MTTIPSYRDSYDTSSAITKTIGLICETLQVISSLNNDLNTIKGLPDEIRRDYENTERPLDI
ncbi:hypothetical protein N7456_007209 [Penicillium angulare]|uniref:Uncharacterized protein n=1 Tax=Penicillium angulare TaxID=116970 RepID=A0A9W9FJ77_9EURO|nr:hypothetical protein N7456_007209 [Penicillium angulare]